MMIEVNGVSHRYGDRVALDDVTLEVAAGELFALLGPNGSGKTTLFRLLCTLIPLQDGTIRVSGCDIRQNPHAARQAMGVVFQAASLDRKLTVSENLSQQAALYGLSGSLLHERRRALLERLGLQERRGELVEKLSGGLRRRVELAKGLLHHPRLLLLDEPTTGLDPAARSDLWEYLDRLRTAEGITILLTTHLLDEADRADRLAILHQGRLVALDTPAHLRSEVGGDSITIRTDDPAGLVDAIRDRFAIDATALGDRVRLEQPQGHQWVPRLVDALRDRIQEITLAGPSLEDVFIARTGHRFWEDAESPEAKSHA